jgi:hypothetical protein
MALSKHPYKLVLHVTEIDVSLNMGASEDRGEEFDLVEIQFHGKVMPSTKKRIREAISNADYDLTDKVLA